MALQAGGSTAYEPTRYDAIVGSDDRRTHLNNHISWGAIIAGVVTALLVQMLIGLAGVGFGLSAFTITGDTGSNPSASSISINAAIWWVVSGLIASLVGGIVAGRLCGSTRHSTAGWHGFVSWCATTLIVVWLVGTALGNVLGGAFSAVGSTLSGAGKSVMAAGGAAANTPSLDAQVKSLVSPNDAQTAQDTIVSYVRASASGDQKAADDAKAKAVDALAKTANITPDEAQKRLDQLQQQAQQAAAKAKDAAEQARKGAAEGSLFAVAALLFGMIASIIGGGLGTPRNSTSVVGLTESTGPERLARSSM